MNKFTNYELSNIQVLKGIINSFKYPKPSLAIKDELMLKGYNHERMDDFKYLLYNSKVFTPCLKEINEFSDLELERMSVLDIVNLACNYFQPFGSNYFIEYENIEQYLRKDSGLSESKINACLNWIIKNPGAVSSGQFYVLNPLECSLSEKIRIGCQDIKLNLNLRINEKNHAFGGPIILVRIRKPIDVADEFLKDENREPNLQKKKVYQKPIISTKYDDQDC